MYTTNETKSSDPEQTNVDLRIKLTKRNKKTTDVRQVEAEIPKNNAADAKELPGNYTSPPCLPALRLLVFFFSCCPAASPYPTPMIGEVS